MADELPLVFDCEDERLVGILHRSGQPAGTGVVVVTGGPQYRVGSHRQFVLLARALAGKGIPVFRFDYRGMGDGGGRPVGFEHVDPDIRAAIDCFLEHEPGLERVVLWGLCDAASAVLMFAHQDERIAGLVLLNPWVRTESGQAKTLVKSYYSRRVLSGDFWRRLLTGKIDVLGAVASFIRNLRRARGEAGADAGPQSYIDRMRTGLERFGGKVLLIISGNDLTAAEFLGLVDDDSDWRRLLDGPLITRVDLDDADHTFSCRRWRGEVEESTAGWIRDAIESRNMGSASGSGA